MKFLILSLLYSNLSFAQPNIDDTPKKPMLKLLGGNDKVSSDANKRAIIKQNFDQLRDEIKGIEERSLIEDEMNKLSEAIKEISSKDNVKSTKNKKTAKGDFWKDCPGTGCPSNGSLANDKSGKTKFRLNNECEEVNESFVVCNGERYEKVRSASSNLKRTGKNVEEYIKSGKINSGSSGSSK